MNLLNIFIINLKDQVLFNLLRNHKLHNKLLKENKERFCYLLTIESNVEDFLLFFVQFQSFFIGYFDKMSWFFKHVFPIIRVII